MTAITYTGAGNHSVKELESICKNQELLLNDKQVDSQYLRLKLYQKQTDIDELVEFIDNNALKLGIIAQLKAIKLIQKHTK